MNIACSSASPLSRKLAPSTYYPASPARPLRIRPDRRSRREIIHFWPVPDQLGHRKFAVAHAMGLAGVAPHPLHYFYYHLVIRHDVILTLAHENVPPMNNHATPTFELLFKPLRKTIIAKKRVWYESHDQVDRAKTSCNVLNVDRVKTSCNGDRAKQT